MRGLHDILGPENAAMLDQLDAAGQQVAQYDSDIAQLQEVRKRANYIGTDLAQDAFQAILRNPSLSPTESVAWEITLTRTMANPLTSQLTARTIDGYNQRAQAVHTQLDTVDGLLKEPGAPIIVFTSPHEPSPDNANPDKPKYSLTDYGFSRSDGSGLSVDGKAHTVTANETEIKGYRANRPLIHRVDASRFLDTVNQPQRAIEVLHYGTQSYKTFYLIGEEPVQEFLKVARIEPRIATIAGHAAMYGYDPSSIERD